MTEVVFALAQQGDAVRLADHFVQDASIVNVENVNGLTLLGYAAHFGHPSCVEVLLRFGADVNAISHSKIDYIPSNTALHAAIAGERNLDVIRLLLENGANPNLFDSNGHTSLHVAAYHPDSVDIANLLLEYGADSFASAEGGLTPIQVAEQRGNHRVLKILNGRNE
jgi:uncharacterized protein